MTNQAICFENISFILGFLVYPTLFNERMQKLKLIEKSS